MDTNDNTNELAEMRNESGVTQEQVARVLGLSGKTPYNWERLPASRVKEYHRISYRAAIEAVLAEAAVIARYLEAA